MPRKQTRSRKGGKGGAGAIGATDEMVLYVPPTGDKRGQMTIAGLQVLSTDVGGSLGWNISGAQYAGFYPLLGNSADWASLVKLWEGYRIRSIRMRFVPRNRYSKVAAATSMFLLGLDLDSLTPTPSMADAVTYANVRVLSMDDPSEVVYAIGQNVGSPWYPTAGSSGLPLNGSLFVANAPGASSVSTTFMDVVYEIELDLRGRA